MRQGKRRRARNIAIAAFLATATAGATIAGLTAANADEDPFTTDKGFDLLKAPGEGDPRVEGVGWAVGGTVAQNHYAADVEVTLGIWEACKKAGFPIEHPKVERDDPVSRDPDGLQVSAVGDCSKDSHGVRFTDSGFDLLKAPGEGDPRVEGIGWAAGGDESWNDSGAVDELFGGIKKACITAGFTEFEGEGPGTPIPHIDMDEPVSREAGGVQRSGTGDCSKFLERQG